MRGYLVGTCITVLTAALLSSGAAAAAASGSEKEVYELGKCIARKDRDAAANLLRDLPLEPVDTVLEPGRLGNASSCVSGHAIPTKALRLRGAVAQALLLRDFPRFGVEPRMAPHLFAKFDLPSEAKPAADARTTNLYRLADCVMRNRGIDAERLFRSGIGSGLEGQVMDSFGPIMSACQGQTGTISVSRADLRSLFAQAAYNVSARYWSGQLWSAKEQ